MSSIISKEMIINISNDFIKNNMELDKLDKELANFVQDIIGHRDKSHGVQHLFRVSRYAIYIAITSSEFKEFLNKSVYNDFCSMLLLIAWLHDLVDHKYAEESATNMEKIKLFFKDSIKFNFVINIINRISYSREEKYGNDDWEQVLGSYGTIIRNIVSDADKLDAIGIDGVQRCIDYVREKNPNITDQEVYLKVLKHADEKLKKLVSSYIYTNIGKLIGVYEDADMRNRLNEISHL